VVETAPLEQGAFQVRSEFVGTLEADTAADLYARSSGPVVRLAADAGDRVRQGQVLAALEADEARQQVEAARAALRIAEATLGQRQANLEVAEATSRRTENLYSQDLVSEQDRDTTQAELVGARSQLELARAQIEQARSSLSAAQLELQKTQVLAPFSGWIGERYLDLGDLASTNRPLFSLVDLSTIRTTVPLTERDAARIAIDQPAEVTVASYPSETFDGRVARIASVFDPETNTTEAQIEVANADARLKPGMFATVRIAYRTEPTALLVPGAALVETPRETYLFVAEEVPAGGDGPPGGAPGGGSPGGSGGGEGGGPPGPSWVARKVPVRVVGTGGTTESRAAVEPLADPDAPGGEGGAGFLVPGARIIVLGQDSLSDGAPVTLAGAGGPAGRTGGPTP
jgi:RND family efflux transporter MFP subunit